MVAVVPVLGLLILAASRVQVLLAMVVVVPGAPTGMERMARVAVGALSRATRIVAALLAAPASLFLGTRHKL
jgi:hypothetical protein